MHFAAGVATLAADPSLLLLEVGPGTALTSLARATLGNDGAARVISSLPHPRERRAQIGGDARGPRPAVDRRRRRDWEGLHRDERLRRVPLPTYPFERKRHWVDAPKRADQAAAPVVARLEDVKDWLHVPTWMRAPLADTKRADRWPLAPRRRRRRSHGAKPRHGCGHEAVSWPSCGKGAHVCGIGRRLPGAPGG